MNNDYLIPANAKKSMLILSVFTLFDIILFGSGVLLTLILLLAINTNNFVTLILLLLPALITGFLVMPVMHYHNVLQFIINVINYINGRRRYYWRGWCAAYEQDETK